jgi:hypothetical protein
VASAVADGVVACEPWSCARSACHLALILGVTGGGGGCSPMRIMYPDLVRGVMASGSSSSSC